MAPSTSVPINGSVIPTSASASGTPETITNIVFGLCALTIGGLTIWQGRRAWKMWMAHAAARTGAEEGLENASHELDVMGSVPGTPSQTAGPPQQLGRTDVPPSTSPPSQVAVGS